jgi:putative endonuclease
LLEQRGFVILARNARAGRLEIDLIARSGELLVFCEVRSLSSDRLMSPAHTITPAKVLRVRAAAAHWLARQDLRRAEIRFDAAAVVFDGATPRIEYYEGAF